MTHRQRTPGNGTHERGCGESGVVQAWTVDINDHSTSRCELRLHQSKRRVVVGIVLRTPANVNTT